MTAIVEPQISPPLPRSNLAMLYYGLVVVATAAVMLVLYNLVVVKWCADQRPPRRSSPQAWRISSSVPMLIFNGGSGSDNSECAICLSVFEQGDQMRQLPECRHCFHAPCIDMWLYSHFDCPLCRSPVEHHRAAAVDSHHSPQEFLV